MLTPADSTRSIRWRSVIEIAALFFLCLGLPACEDPPPEPGTPVLQIHGTKPPSIDLSLRIRYVATTEKRQCQQYDMGIPGYKPIKPTWHVWPHEPPSRKPDRRYRVVPMDTTGALPDSLQGKDLEPFRWTVNAGWGGEPTGCNFVPTRLTFMVYHKTKKGDLVEAGYPSITTNAEYRRTWESSASLNGDVIIGCKWGGFSSHIPLDSLRCDFPDVPGYRIDTLREDVRDLPLYVRYLNSRSHD